MLYEPDNSNRIMILGKNAGNIPPESLDQFNIVSKEIESPIHTVQCPIHFPKQMSNATSSISDSENSDFYLPHSEEMTKPAIEHSVRQCLTSSVEPLVNNLSLVQEPFSIFCTEHDHSLTQLECAECYNRMCSQYLIDSTQSHYGEWPCLFLSELF